MTDVLWQSFVTNLFESSPSESTKLSAQSLLRHGAKMQSETYDRRTPAAKKLEAQRFAVGSSKRERSPEATPVGPRRTVKLAAIEWTPGMLTVVPFVDTESGEKRFWFAKILSVIDAAEAQLMELVSVANAEGVYRANIASTWRESTVALKLCDAGYHSASNSYHLRTPASDIIGLLQ